MGKYTFYLLIILNLYSCSAQNKNEIIQIIEENKIEWINSWECNPLYNLSIDSYDTIIIEYSYLYEKKDIYDHFYIYSPSKNQFVDIYSRTMDIEVEGSDTIITYLEAEAEIVLFDSIKKTKNRILFVSNSTYFEDVIWVTDNCFIVLGTCYERGEQPLIIIYDIENMIYAEYKCLIGKRIYNYLDKKFNIR